MNQWIYKETDEGVWSVGFYSPQGQWEPVSNHDDPEVFREATFHD